jgi:hypothetical protein
VASKAIDGQNTICTDPNSAITEAGNSAWWQASFDGGAKKVYSVVVYHETDCCAGQMKGGTVMIVNGGNEIVCGTLQTDLTSIPETVLCNGAVGQQVKIVSE